MTKTITKEINLKTIDGTLENNFKSNYTKLHYFLLDEIENNGAFRMTYITKNGIVRTYRIFNNDSQIGYFEGKSRKHGYLFDIHNVAMILTLEYPFIDESTPVEKMVAKIEKAKALFAKKCHPNLWQELQKGYQIFDRQEYMDIYNTIEDSNSFHSKEMQALYKYEEQKDFHVLHEYYKTTTIKSNKPTISGHRDYDSCISNIKARMDNKEDFLYFWQSGYDVTVEGKSFPDGSYKAWLSLEYRGCGNGHYYFLINENTAIFAEDD